MSRESAAAHLVGSIGEIGAAELGRENFPSYRSGDVLGKSGIELSHEAHLRGKVGGRNIVVDVAGQEIEIVNEVQPIPGGRIVLTPRSRSSKGGRGGLPLRGSRGAELQGGAGGHRSAQRRNPRDGFSARVRPERFRRRNRFLGVERPGFR